MRKILGKRILLMLLVAIMVFSTACSPAQEAEEPESSEPEENQESEAPEDNEEASEAADWPEQPINIVVPASAGGGTDIITRIFTKYITEETGQACVITNITGLSGYEQVRKQDPNGYNYMIAITGLLISKAQGQIDFGHEVFDGVHIMGSDSSTGIIVRNDSPYETLDDLFAAVEENPDNVTGGISKTGYPYLIMQSMKDALDLDIYTIDAGNTAERAVALLGGHVDFIVAPMAPVKGYLDSGDFRYLAVVADERNPGLPDVPTFLELGYDYSFVDQSLYLVAPEGTNREVLNKFNELLLKIQTNPEFLEEIERFSMVLSDASPEEVDEQMDEAAEVFQKYID